MLSGPVLKLVILSFSRTMLRRRWGAAFPPTGHSSARSGSPSLIVLTSVSGGRGKPDAVKNVSKYKTKALTFVRRCAVETSLKDDEKSSCREVISVSMKSYIVVR